MRAGVALSWRDARPLLGRWPARLVVDVPCGVVNLFVIIIGRAVLSCKQVIVIENGQLGPIDNE
jgi:hypothetical protein